MLITLRLYSQKPFFVTTFAALSAGSSAQAFPAGFAALHYHQLVIVFISSTYIVTKTITDFILTRLVYGYKN